MAKFYGSIGFVETKETPSGSGIYKESITEYKYYGDVIRDTRRWVQGERLNDNLTLGSQFSIVADAFALSNFEGMRYIVWMGVSWKITSVDIQRPRIILTVGEVYNGN